MILATVHSGIGGEGQALRSALEGTGINRAAFPLDVVQRKLEALRGAQVALNGADAELRVLGAGRVQHRGWQNISPCPRQMRWRWPLRSKGTWTGLEFRPGAAGDRNLRLAASRRAVGGGGERYQRGYLPGGAGERRRLN